MSESQSSDKPQPHAAELLTEHEALRILMQPAPPDRFAILSRRGRPLSEADALRILQEQSGSDRVKTTSQAASPLPVAQRAPPPIVPLDYRRPVRQILGRSTPNILPLHYRLLGLAVWLAVALALIIVIILSR